ncbi:hypothetical protein [Nocardia sp. NBC_01329]|nr:hypothetical protein OG405_01130 [Nocardia sp. NBC_01329]
MRYLASEVLRTRLTLLPGEPLLDRRGSDSEPWTEEPRQRRLLFSAHR